ncbi:hypothetical protein K443DRAFT_15004 [Laccaria amethystina LaAM-08-1]|uniref:Unplaced genomic scaffold K443scaffold_591, whole genome shotgun sequence n=1 Tax=Laccaria amethystina LaAM-08-1 TaxID=1095629 RepID=A0A0C9WLY4_9AGAR|nr:hypothetical protein K443DRAFT_15004 [Laccaria amethystina LaAM-08-1]
MRTKFEEFRFCEGDWKVHVFATVRYPDWSEDVREQPSLIKRKAPEDEEIAKKKKKTKKQHVNAPPPSDANVIDLATEDRQNSDLKTPSSISSPVTPSQPRLSSMIMKSSTPTDESPSKHVQEGRTSPVQAPQHAPSPPQRTLTSVSDPQNNGKPLSASHSNCRPAPFSKGNPTASVPQNDSNTPLVPPPAQIDDKPTSTLHSDRLPLQSPQPDDEQVPAPPVLDKMANIPRTGDGADEPDLFVDSSTNLIISPPLVQVHHTADPATTKPKKGKAMEPSKAITAQNLFAIDYLNEHTTTTKAEFKKVFDALDDSSKQKYSALAKQKKLEEALAKKSAQGNSK